MRTIRTLAACALCLASAALVNANPPQFGKMKPPPQGPALKLEKRIMTPSPVIASMQLGKKITPVVTPVVIPAKLQPKINVVKLPPNDFKLKPIALDKIKLPAKTPAIAKLGAGFDLQGAKFLLNKSFCTTGDYHLKCGTVYGSSYCYVGKHHCHWHHCIWDTYCGCHCYYDPCLCVYYYWYEPYGCYYPCSWVVTCEDVVVAW